MRAAFTGHRPPKISGYNNSPESVETAVRRVLRNEIVREAAEGVDTFLCGMAPGVDLWAADELLLLRSSGDLPQSTILVAVIPFAGFQNDFSPLDRQLFERVAARADRTEILSTEYARNCYNRRNDYLVDNADRIIAYYEGIAGGTRYTIRRARRRGRQVVNLFGGELFR
ncbi:MAG: SLOG family protein [Tidjanibacter sp.]|nr:SLOG family protein [Tidjanibacter sp.]